MVIRAASLENLFTIAETAKASTLSPEEKRAASESVSRARADSAARNAREKIYLPADLRKVHSGANNNCTLSTQAATLYQQYYHCTARLRCAEGTFRVHKIYGDGNCLFRAVSYILWGSEEEHRALRTRVTHHIKSHWREYGPFVAAEWSITSPDAYYNFMISEGVFATELECTVATKLYGMNLSIYREIIGSGGQVKRVFHNRVDGSYETARLLFSGRSDSGHYDVLFVDF